MNGAMRPADAKGNSDPMAELLSVDSEAHLQKLAACMFPSPAQLPVELVRSALKRGAATVRLQVRHRRLTIHDDGRGIDTRNWLQLACAFDPGRGAADREKAITALQDDSNPGIGLLAVSIPGRSHIRIEDAGIPGGRTMEIASGRVRLTDSCGLVSGTRIAIARTHGPADEEMKLVRELCAAVPQLIVLNGQALEKKPVLRRTLVRQPISTAPGGAPATVAIPARGDVCRIWLLDQGIPWQAFTSASYHGLVFEAALESAAPPTGPFFSELAESAYRLYHWLAARYDSFPERYQDRIEELIFRKARFSGDLQLLSSFSPFRLWRSKQRLNLEEVRRKAGSEILYALPRPGDPGRVLGRHAQALWLTPLQQDFLLNHLHLPLFAPAAPMRKANKQQRLRHRCARTWGLLMASLPRPLIRILPAGQLDGDEERFCRELEKQWQRLQIRQKPERPPLPLTVAMVRGRGLAPAFRRPAGMGAILLIRRRHPLVRKALCCLRSDSANIEWIFAALDAPHF